MNTTTVGKEQKPLPRLIKGQSTYKIIVPEKVEEKIRYLIRKFPRTEWSGVLFYRRQGTFEENNLVLICEDIFPMDLGTSGWTEFQMSEDVTAYIAENLDLFNCETGLVHSHHTLGAFFSGQDDKMLQQEGDDTNCFLSLVVDTPGNYVARITRKLRCKSKVAIQNLGTTYNFFGEGERTLTTSAEPKESIKEETVIQYFDLEVERHEVSNSLDFLDRRFDEIEAQKKKAETNKTAFVFDGSFKDWRTLNNEEEYWDTSDRKTSAETKEALLFSKEEMGEIDASKWKPNSQLIHEQLVRMILCSMTISADKVDLKQWIVKHMEKVYKKIFPEMNVVGGDPFDSWCDFAVEFFVETLEDDSTPWDSIEIDQFYALVAEAMIEEISTYNVNPYLQCYINSLSRYLEY